MGGMLVAPMKGGTTLGGSSYNWDSRIEVFVNLAVVIYMASYT